MMLTGLATVLREAGLTVVEQDGWKTRGHGQMVAVRGVTCHHTAGGRSKRPRRSLDTVQKGRPGLAGPLAHLYLDVDGVFYVVAAGLCWHAGASRKPDQTNSYRIGIEAEAAGDGWTDDWPAVQMDAYARGCKALAEHYDFPVSEVLAHKETCSPPGRKPDPHPINMNDFRADVRAVDLEDSMPLTDTDLAKIAATLDKKGFVTTADLTAALAAVNSRIDGLSMALASRKEDGFYFRAEGDTAVYQVLSAGDAGTYKVWVDGDDYAAAGRPEVSVLPAGDPLVQLQTKGQKPDVPTKAPVKKP